MSINLPFLGDKKTYDDIYQWAKNDPEDFWGNLSKILKWDKPYTQVFENKNLKGARKWFLGGKLNYSHTLLDQKVLEGEGNKEALIVYTNHGQRKSYSYSKLLRTVKQIAAGFEYFGFNENSRVLICGSPKVAEKMVVSALALQRLGVLFGFVYYRFPNEIIKNICNKIKVTHLIYDYLGREELKILHPKFTGIKSLNSLIVFDKIPESKNLFSKMMLWDNIFDYGHNHSNKIFDANKPSLYVLSSGTTGIPKCLLLGTAGAYINITGVFIQMVCNIKKNDSFWMPIDFGFGATFPCICSTLICGGKIIIREDQFRLGDKQTRNIIEKENVKSIFLPPAYFEYALQQNESIWPYKNYIKTVILGGQKPTIEVWKLLQKSFDNDYTSIVNVLGQGEACSATFSTLPERKPNVKNYLKLFPLPGVNFAISDGGLKGELMLENKIPSLCVGYIQNNEEYEKLWFNDYKYMRTGDIAKRHHNVIEVIGRKVEGLIKFKGRFLNLTELKYIIKSMGNIKDVEIVNRVDKGVSNLVAFVISDEYDKKRFEESIKSMIRAKVGSYAMPKQIVFLEEFPRLAKGSIDKQNLLKLLDNQHE